MKVVGVDELMAAMYHAAFENDSDLQKWDSGCWIRYKLFENVLAAIPRHELPDRKVGKWIYWGKIRVICSVCKREPYAGKGADSFEYCPHCGAKMEAEDADA